MEAVLSFVLLVRLTIGPQEDRITEGCGPPII
jgi:hypothetical protein